MSQSENTDYFKKSARKEFEFLQDRYGFSEASLPKNSNEYSVLFVNDTTKVLVEGIHWGSSARVALGNALSAKFENYDLGDLLTALGEEKLSDAEYSEMDQNEQLRYFSVALSKIGKPILTGDFAEFSKIKEIIEQRVREWKTNN
jgi:hypothetical protein